MHEGHLLSEYCYLHGLLGRCCSKAQQCKQTPFDGD